MYAAKGQRQPDGTYIYTCGKCHGRDGNQDCDWCYGLNLDRIVEEMQKGARGQRYYSLLKAHLSITGKEIVDEWQRLKEEKDALRAADIGYLSLKFRLNFKATWEWLEENWLVNVSYDRFAESALTVREVYEETRRLYPELEKSDE